MSDQKPLPKSECCNAGISRCRCPKAETRCLACGKFCNTVEIIGPYKIITEFGGLTKEQEDLLLRRLSRLDDHTEIPSKTNSDSYFGLTYASWLVLPRTALQSMPEEWQNKFFLLVEELYDCIEFPEPQPDSYEVTARKDGKFIALNIPPYRHNRLPYKPRPQS